MAINQFAYPQQEFLFSPEASRFAEQPQQLPQSLLFSLNEKKRCIFQPIHISTRKPIVYTIIICHINN